MSSNKKELNFIVITGPTATGKTKVAVDIAYQYNGEIISADSRQIYKGMDIGTGKDLDEYIVNNKQIPYHLIDILDPNEIIDKLIKIYKLVKHVHWTGYSFLVES